MKHTCIKPGCSTRYETEDPDPYYCKSCDEQRKIIAKEVDAKMTGRTKRPTKSLLQEYDEAQKVNGFMRVKL